MVGFTESNFYKVLQDFFINTDKETFLEMLAEFYNRTESIINKNEKQDEIIKNLYDLYIMINDKGIDENIVRQKIDFFLENNPKLQYITNELNENITNVQNIAK